MKIIDYTLNSIEDTKHNITFTTDTGEKITENIDLGKFNTKAELETALSKYGEAYLNGLKITTIPAKEIEAIIGIKQIIKIEKPTPILEPIIEPIIEATV